MDTDQPTAPLIGVPPAEAAAALPSETPKLKYWQEKAGIAPIKSEYVLWHKMGKPGSRGPAPDDDAAEGRSNTARERVDQPQTVLSTADVASAEAAVSAPDPAAATAPASAAVPSEPATTAANATATPADPSASTAVPTSESKPSHPRSDGSTGDALPEPKKARLSGAEKKKAARERQQKEWEAKQAAKAAAKQAGEGHKTKKNGQNHASTCQARKFDNRAGVDAIKLCSEVAQGRECNKVTNGKPCKWSHDLAGYLAARLPDVPLSLPTDPNTLDPSTYSSSSHPCPAFLRLGACPSGFKCRFGESHMAPVAPGTGVAGTAWVQRRDDAKAAAFAAERAARGQAKGRLSEKGELNAIGMEVIRETRQGAAREDKFPLSAAYMREIGEPLDAREEGGKGGRGGKGGKGGKGGDRNAEKAKGGQQGGELVDMADMDAELDFDQAAAPAPVPAPAPAAADIDSHPSRSFVPDLAPIRAAEKKRLDFKGKTYLAPLTTVGNLPFRRLAVQLGCDITCSEMGLATEFLGGNTNEWSLVRRHPSEKMFGVQICGSRPQALVPTAEAIVKHCEIDFLDINCGCPIDLVFNKGAGSALLQHAAKLGKSLVGMSRVLGETPLTIKIRTGVSSKPEERVAHKLAKRVQTEWGCGALTLHGRSRQQRYKTRADYEYIGEVARTLRETAEEQGLPSIPILGNGDAYDHRQYWDDIERSGVDSIMVARGGLIKPWIFTEIKERRDWDISSRERLDMIGQLCDYGLEHWGSDTQGLNTTRRFVTEALSFTHRYIPVGLLERLPVQLNERPFPFQGRDQLETLLASDQAADWVKITEMFLGPAPAEWSFTPKHKANATGEAEG